MKGLEPERAQQSSGLLRSKRSEVYKRERSERLSSPFISTKEFSSNPDISLEFDGFSANKCSFIHLFPSLPEKLNSKTSRDHPRECGENIILIDKLSKVFYNKQVRK
jgi:hypothetical protein